MPSFPSAHSRGRSPPQRMSPFRREALAQPAVTLALQRGGCSSELKTAFWSLAANSQRGHSASLGREGRGLSPAQSGGELVPLEAEEISSCKLRTRES